MKDDDVTREEQLISRVVDGDASTADWTELELLAHADAAVWERLAGSLHTEARLRNAVDEALSIADEVELHGPPSTISRLRPWLAGSGWAAAAVMIISWLIHTVSGPADLPLEPAGPRSLEEYVRAGHDAGRIVGVLPTQVLRAVPAADGENLDVIYLRGWLERAAVKELYEVGENEAGMATSIPVSWTKYVSSGPY